MFPVIRHFADRLDVEPGIAFGMAQRLDDGPQAGLRGSARKRVHGRIDGIHAGIAGGHDRGHATACRIMGVEMDGQANLLFQRLDEDLGRRRFHQPRHVLQAQHMGACRL